MVIKRDIYLNKLKNRMHNGMIKVVTGVRRCGKSFLLFDIFYNYLLQSGVDKNHILRIALDDIANKKFRNPDTLYAHVKNSILDSDRYYIILDEIQFVYEFEDVLNGFLHIENTDIYVSGSNAKFLSKDILTEFRGRGDEIRVYPLSFSEFMSAYDGDKYQGLQTYMLYGGMPQLFSFPTDEQKTKYLQALFNETYIKDIITRNSFKNGDILEELLDILSSSIGSYTSANKLVNTFKSVKHASVNYRTIKRYIDALCDAFIIDKALRYDIKGKKYIDAPEKFYFTDLGLRNARLNFRQFERTHIMENIIYNELKIRGYNVDIGIVEVADKSAIGTFTRKQLEVDFIANLGNKRYYIQSAYSVPTDEKARQEIRSLNAISDSFKKIIVTEENTPLIQNEQGVVIMNIYDFLLNTNSLY